MKWQPYIRPFNVWSWAAPELPNGWTPSVTDDSQMYAPKRTTRYTASASCSARLISHPEHFDSFEAAKDAAVMLAMAQDPTQAQESCLQPKEESK